jgi:hypothetical protein
MTVAQAEAICSVVPGVVASKGSSGFCHRSQLGNWSMVDISNAFALLIAKNRQMVAADANARRLCKEYAEKAGALLVSLRMIVISDADAERLSRLDRGSPEYDEARRKLVISLLEDKSPEWQRFLKLEGLDAFNNYCWSLDADDPLYWKQVYARLNLPQEGAKQGEALSRETPNAR